MHAGNMGKRTEKRSELIGEKFSRLKNMKKKNNYWFFSAWRFTSLPMKRRMCTAEEEIDYNALPFLQGMWTVADFHVSVRRG